MIWEPVFLIMLYFIVYLFLFLTLFLYLVDVCLETIENEVSRKLKKTILKVVAEEAIAWRIGRACRCCRSITRYLKENFLKF